MAVQRAVMTVDEFEQFIARPENRDRNFELINGEIIEKMPTQKHGRIAGVLVKKIGIFLDQNPIGYVEIEVRYRIPEDMLNAVQPDVSVVKDVVTPSVEQGAVPKMPDLAVEIKSPDDTFRQMRDKAEYYLKHGAKLVWLVYPEQHVIEVYAPEVDSKMLTERDTLDGGEVLPGFSLAASELFKTP